MGPQNFQAVATLARQWASDPIAFVLGALDDLSAHPQYAPQLRSHVARILATRGGNGNGGNGHAHAQADEPEPKPDIVVDGYAWYSAQQQAAHDRWLVNRTLAQVRQEIQPLQDDIRSRQDRDTVVAAQQAADKFASDTLSEMRKLPYFTERKADIEQVFRAMPPMPDAHVGQAIRDAYIQVLVTKVLPTLTQTAKSELLSNLNQKAAASSRNPATGQVATSHRPRSFEEALRQADAARGR